MNMPVLTFILNPGLTLQHIYASIIRLGIIERCNGFILLTVMVRSSNEFFDALECSFLDQSMVQALI